MNLFDYFDKNKVDYYIHEHKPTFTAHQLAIEEHVLDDEVAKPVLVNADNKYYLCVLPASRKINLKKLRRKLGALEIRLADEQELSQIFPDAEIGAEPPIGTLYNIPTIADKALLKDKRIVFQAGTHDKAIRMSIEDFLKIVKPQVMRFSHTPFFTGISSEYSDYYSWNETSWMEPPFSF